MTDRQPMDDASPIEGPIGGLGNVSWMPLFGYRLLKSDQWLSSNNDERVAAFQLWWEAWLQKPAGSLPNDDRILAHLAGTGGDLRKWKPVRERALQGFELGDDGRLHHPFLRDLVDKT